MNTTRTSDPEDEWYAAWFASDYYLALYSHRDRSEAALCVDLVMRGSNIRDTDSTRPKVLDVCCGAGRHAVVLAEKGFDVTAIDLSPTLLAEARNEAERRHVFIDFVRSDMREINYVDKFDLATQLFTSFGYFHDHTEDRKVLRGVYRALHEGGYYVLDLMNPDMVTRTLEARTEKHVGPIHVTESREIVNKRVIKNISIQAGSQSYQYTESVRLYTRAEISDMLTSVGFSVLSVYGDYHGATFDAKMSDRMILICRAVD